MDCQGLGHLAEHIAWRETRAWIRIRTGTRGPCQSHITHTCDVLPQTVALACGCEFSNRAKYSKGHVATCYDGGLPKQSVFGRGNEMWIIHIHTFKIFRLNKSTPMAIGIIVSNTSHRRSILYIYVYIYIYIYGTHPTRIIGAIYLIYLVEVPSN